MVRAVLFDLGGTLDGDGQHWLDRFVDLYADAGASLPRETVRRAFDHAEQRAAVDGSIVTAGFDRLVRQHLLWQAEVHRLTDPALHNQLARAFVQPIHQAGVRNCAVLAQLHRAGLELGVVSNACGNASTLCADLGYSSYLSFVIDSRVVGVAKPDPAIFMLALERLRVPAETVLMVGDSYERDIVPAHGLRMQTAWLVADMPPARGVADVVIQSLSELPAFVRQTERLPA